MRRAREEYSWPGEKEEVSELTSLQIHAERYFKPMTTAIKPGDEEIDWILYEMEKAYRTCVWVLPDDYDSYDKFVEAVRSVDMSSSPGVPYMREAPTNGEWLKSDGINFDPFQMKRLWYDVNLVLQDKWEHLIRVFVKQEPHKRAKVQEGRWRLIMASSLPVQIVWQMLFKYQNDLEIKNAYNIPSQQGFTMIGGDWKLYRQSWVSAGKTVGLDKSAWDWTVPHWLLMADLEFRCRMARGSRLDDWYQLARVMYRHMFEEAKLVISDGTIYKQTVPGIMKSGCLNTISTNSHGQVMIHLLATNVMGVSPYPLCSACGDDTLQTPEQSWDVGAYSRYGVVVKSASESIEFVGHEFTASGPAPLYMEKHFKKLEYVSEEILGQYLDSMARMYVHTRYFEFWESLALALGHPLPLSKRAYLYWYDVSAD